MLRRVLFRLCFWLLGFCRQRSTPGPGSLWRPKTTRHAPYDAH